ncbi:MAG TPA: 16S rRNA methyltransferase [Clostridiales bacterium]|nr:16S rRNA methyltransferase [Clostridiales bacterium]
MPHYFDENPSTEHRPAEWQIRFRGQDFRFLTDSGVFSRRRLDFGSELLIETVIRDQGKLAGRLLDLGCGYGPIGIVLKRLFPALEVVLADVNTRALDLARQNVRLNQTLYLEICQSDGLQSVAGDFNFILLNPPIRAGKAVVYRLFAEAAERLRPGGRLYVVIQKKQGAQSALRQLQALCGSAAVIERQAGYWILQAG